MAVCAIQWHIMALHRILSQAMVFYGMLKHFMVSCNILCWHIMTFRVFHDIFGTSDECIVKVIFSFYSGYPCFEMGYRLVNLMDHMADYLKEKIEIDEEGLRRHLAKTARSKSRIRKITKRVIDNMFKPGWIFNEGWKSQTCSEIFDNIAVINIFIEENGLFDMKHAQNPRSKFNQSYYMNLFQRKVAVSKKSSKPNQQNSSERIEDAKIGTGIKNGEESVKASNDLAIEHELQEVELNTERLQMLYRVFVCFDKGLYDKGYELFLYIQYMPPSMYDKRDLEEDPDIKAKFDFIKQKSEEFYNGGVSVFNTCLRRLTMEEAFLLPNWPHIQVINVEDILKRLNEILIEEYDDNEHHSQKNLVKKIYDEAKEVMKNVDKDEDQNETTVNCPKENSEPKTKLTKQEKKKLKKQRQKFNQSVKNNSLQNDSEKLVVKNETNIEKGTIGINISPIKCIEQGVIQCPNEPSVIDKSIDCATNQDNCLVTKKMQEDFDRAKDFKGKENRVKVENQNETNINSTTENSEKTKLTQKDEKKLKKQWENSFLQNDAEKLVEKNDTNLEKSTLETITSFSKHECLYETPDKCIKHNNFPKMSKEQFQKVKDHIKKRAKLDNQIEDNISSIKENSKTTKLTKQEKKKLKKQREKFNKNVEKNSENLNSEEVAVSNKKNAEKTAPENEEEDMSEEQIEIFVKNAKKLSKEVSKYFCGDIQQGQDLKNRCQALMETLPPKYKLEFQKRMKNREKLKEQQVKLSHDIEGDEMSYTMKRIDDLYMAQMDDEDQSGKDSEFFEPEMVQTMNQSRIDLTFGGIHINPDAFSENNTEGYTENGTENLETMIVPIKNLTQISTANTKDDTPKASEDPEALVVPTVNLEDTCIDLSNVEDDACSENIAEDHTDEDDGDHYPKIFPTLEFTLIKITCSDVSDDVFLNKCSEDTMEDHTAKIAENHEENSESKAELTKKAKKKLKKQRQKCNKSVKNNSLQNDSEKLVVKNKTNAKNVNQTDITLPKAKKDSFSDESSKHIVGEHVSEEAENHDDRIIPAQIDLALPDTNDLLFSDSLVFKTNEDSFSDTFSKIHDEDFTVEKVETDGDTMDQTVNLTQINNTLTNSSVELFSDNYFENYAEDHSAEDAYNHEPKIFPTMDFTLIKITLSDVNVDEDALSYKSSENDVEDTEIHDVKKNQVEDALSDFNAGAFSEKCSEFNAGDLIVEDVESQETNLVETITPSQIDTTLSDIKDDNFSENNGQTHTSEVAENKKACLFHPQNNMAASNTVSDKQPKSSLSDDLAEILYEDLVVNVVENLEPYLDGKLIKTADFSDEFHRRNSEQKLHSKNSAKEKSSRKFPYKTKDKDLEKSPLTTFEPINLGAMFEETILASDEHFLANCKTNYTGFLVRL